MKEYWNDKDKRRGVIVTAVIHLALLLVFLFFGLKYYEPKPEDGIVINFGYSETGSGNQDNGAPTPSKPQPQEQQPEQVTETENITETSQNPVQTQNAVDAPSLETQTAKKTNPKKEEPVKEPKPDPQPSQELQDLLKQTQQSKEGGEGVAGGPGDQGDPDGDKNSQNRTGGGGGGAGGDGNYQLGGRRALEKPRPDYPCSEEGRVVVKIYVNRSGKVTRAQAGEKIPNGAATTTTSSCLYSQAENAAMRTTWQADSDAPETQVGYIVYNFRKQ